MQFVRKGKEYLPFGQIFSAPPAAVAQKRGGQPAGPVTKEKRRILFESDKTSDFAAGRNVNTIWKTEKSFVSLLWNRRESPNRRAFPFPFSLPSAQKRPRVGKITQALEKITKHLGKITKDLVSRKSYLEKTTAFVVHGEKPTKVKNLNFIASSPFLKICKEVSLCHFLSPTGPGGKDIFSSEPWIIGLKGIPLHKIGCGSAI